MKFLRFLLGLGWIAFCFWLFTRIGFAMQVMDPADVLVDKQHCTPATEGCFVTARVEGQFDRTWLVTVKSTGETFEVGDSVLTSRNYDPDTYRPGPWTMGALLAGFMVSAVLGSYVINGGRFRRKPEAAVQG